MFLVCTGLMGFSLHMILFVDKGGITSQIIFWLLFWWGKGLIFTQKKSTVLSLIDPPPKVNNELTCYQKYEVHEGKASDK